MVECNIKEPALQDEIESLLSFHDKLAFTCTTRNDFDVLMTKVYGDNKHTKGMGVSGVTIRYIESGLDAYPPIANEEKVRYLEFRTGN